MVDLNIKFDKLITEDEPLSTVESQSKRTFIPDETKRKGLTKVDCSESEEKIQELC